MMDIDTGSAGSKKGLRRGGANAAFRLLTLRSAPNRHIFGLSVSTGAEKSL
jgi:hypothetical protein